MSGFALSFLIGSFGAAGAETIEGALVKAYRNNPVLNAGRAGTRAADENVPIANSGYLPRVTATGDVAKVYSQAGGVGTGLATTSTNGTSSNTFANGTAGASAGAGTASGTSLASSGVTGPNDAVPRSAGLQVAQTLFDGLRTTNAIRQAESGVFGQRETLRTTEQSTLQSAAQAYMDVLRDTAVLALRASNIKVLGEQLRQNQDLLKVGEVTRTDVAQSEAGLAGSRADYYTAQANLQNSIASFRQVVGEQPKRLEPAQPLTRRLPPSLDAAIAISQVEHPNVQAAMHAVDAADLQVKIAEGALAPQVGLNASTTASFDSAAVGSRVLATNLSVGANIPIYQGSAPYALVRQAKEAAGQARYQVAVVRDQVRAAIISSWGLLESSKIVLQSNEAQVRAAEIALNGIREEARVGQRTTLDVLNAQQTLLNARVLLVAVQRDRVVATYAVLASIGRLSTRTLGLRVETYDPIVHFDQVKDRWSGLRTPDGR